MKFRKKPVIIEAFKWTGGPDQEDDPQWMIDAIKDGTVYFERCASDNHVKCMVIETLEGDHRASFGDYLIQGVKGEIYPCKPDIFELTYEVAE